MKLTSRKIEDLKCPQGKKDAMVFDDEQRGLAVRVTSGGSKTYLAQYTFAGRKKRVPLGAVTGISLDAARKATAAVLGEVAQGRDPAAARKASRKQEKLDRLTLDDLVEQWAALRLSERRASYSAEATRALRVAFAKKLSVPAAELTREAVVRVTDKLTADGKAAMASRTAAYGRACYAWAIKRGTLEINPFDALPLEPVDRRERVLSDDELRSIWKATEGVGSFNAIVRALMLTGQRRDEVTSLTWDEITPDRSTWILPAERTKNGVAHIVPLSEQMRALLSNRGAKPRNDKIDGDEKNANPLNLVFPGREGSFNGFSKAKIALDNASGVTDWRLHDLRRTFATGLQRLGIRLEVTESVLNHVSGSRAGIVGIYQRHDFATEKRTALDAWGAHIDGVVCGREAIANVTPIRQGFAQ